MVYLEKTWVRILLSLFIGGITNELFKISSGQLETSSSNKDSYITILVAAIIFIVLNKIVKRKNKL